MRDFIIFAIVFSLLPFTLKRPAIGILLYTWISLMNPHRLAYGAAHDFPFAAIIAAITIIGLFFSNRPKQFPSTPVTVTLIIFMAWMTLTSFFALEPQLVWTEWNRVMKTLFIVLLAILALNSEKEIKAFVWVIGLSLAFYGLKGGVFTLVSGGSNHVFGPEGSYIADNNAIALALVTALPIVWYLKLHTGRRWLRVCLTCIAVLTILAVAGSYSRGALLAGGAMLLFLWLKSQYKLRVGIALILLVPLIFAVMPEQWFDRMNTIDNYKEDASALGRINAWHFAANVAQDNLMGGGFNVFTKKMFLIYAPEPFNHHAAHSIYFQVLGEHGFIGFSLFMLMMLFTWRTGTRIVQFCRDKAELKWASDLAALAQVSLVGFAAGGAFLTLAYYDLYYDIIALLVVLEKTVMLRPAIPQEHIVPVHLPAAPMPRYQEKRS